MGFSLSSRLISDETRLSFPPRKLFFDERVEKLHPGEVTTYNTSVKRDLPSTFVVVIVVVVVVVVGGFVRCDDPLENIVVENLHRIYLGCKE